MMSEIRAWLVSRGAPAEFVEDVKTDPAARRAMGHFMQGKCALGIEHQNNGDVSVSFFYPKDKTK